MEMILNLAWVACSLGIILLWARTSGSNPAPRKVQILALAMVVLLLLPVISLSDDLMAMQGSVETDTCLRRAFHSGDADHSAVPAALGMPEAIFAGQLQAASFPVTLRQYEPALPAAFHTPSLGSRPPPQA